MSTILTIRNLNPVVKQKLRVQAAINGRGMEAEAHEILTRSVMKEEKSLPPQSGDSVCKSVRGIWKGRFTTDRAMELTRGE